MNPIVDRTKALMRSLRRRLRGGAADAAKSATAAGRFAEIYQTGAWGSAESVSGVGSERRHTQEVGRQIEALVAELQVRSFLDAPCGDFNWMSQVRLDGIDYIGADVVAPLIEQNRRRYAGPQRSFEVRDISADPLPKVDMILCRDCLVHLSFEQIGRALRNFKNSGSTWLLTTTFVDKLHNRDIVAGDWRALNLSLPPFSFPPPTKLVNELYEDAEYSDKSLGLWRLVDLLV